MKRLSFLWPLYISEFFRWLGFITPIWILFYQSRSLNLADIGFVASGIYLASVALEYPTGIFADRYGRKSSIIVSIILSALALFVEVTSHSVAQFFVGALLTGASWAFTSGAREALIYDSLKEKKLEKLNSKVLGSLDTVGAIGGVISATTGAVIFVWNNVLPFWLSIIADAFALTFLLFYKEPKYRKKAAKAFETFKNGLRLALKNPFLLSLLILYIPLFFFEDAWYNAQQPILIGLGLPIALLGIYQGAKAVFFAIGGIVLPKLLKKFNHKMLLGAIIIIEFLVWLVIGSNSLYAVIIFSYILILAHQFWNYVYADIVHKHIPSHIRATTLSANQMMISIIWIFNPWLMGYLMNTFNRNILFPIFSMLILIIGLGVFFSRRKYF